MIPARMRRSILAAVFTFAFTATASAFTGPEAQSAFVERRGFLEVDTRCRLLAAGPRAALEAGALQARGALLRSGWTRARVDELAVEFGIAVHAASRPGPRGPEPRILGKGPLPPNDFFLQAISG